MERKVIKRGGKPNRGGGRFKRGGGGRGRGRGGDRGGPRGGRGGGGGWSASKKGGIDYDDSIDGPSVNDPYSNHHANYREEPRRSAAAPSSTRGRGRGSGGNLKLEMQRLHMTAENQDMVRETLQSLQVGDADPSLSYDERYEADDAEAEYDELDVRAEGQYWLTDRTLVVEDAFGFDVSQNKTGRSAKGVSQENVFAIKKLQRCGFSNELCQEALQICDGDVGAALEYLLNDLFNISLTIEETDDGQTEKGEIAKDILEAREDEKLALQSIYDVAFEERIPNKTWLLNLELPELSELLSERISTQPRSSRYSSEKKDKKICPFYLKGSCKFKDRCRYSHGQPMADLSGEGDMSHPIYANLKALEEEKKSPFSIEIRFPDGNRYPYEPPLIAFSAVMEELPSHTRLNITQFLMSLAKEAAEDHLPCVFTLVSALEDRDKLDELLSLPPPALSKPVSVPQKPLPSVNPSLSSSKQRMNNVDDSNKLVKHKGPDKSGQRTQDEGQDKDLTSSQSSYPRKTKESVPTRSNPIEIKRQNRILQDEFRKKQNTKQYQNMQSDRQRLPAWDMRGLVVETVNNHQVVVISGMTGCGKTTQVPQFLLDEVLQQRDIDVNIVCTQPRRISAMAVAQRVADERAEKLGRSVGYQIRLESVMSSFTRLLFCTTGIILRRLESDPDLEGVTHIIIDEVHERSEESDFLLMILRDLLEEKPDLKVILMSATVNAELFSSYFGGCPVLEIPGRTYPVQQFFLEDAIEYSEYRLKEKSPYSRPMKHTNTASQLWDGDENEIESCQGNSQPANDSVPDMKLDVKQLKWRYSGYSSATLKTLSLMDLEKINFELIVQLLEWIVGGLHEFPSEGAILIFMPGFAEIQTLYDMLLSTSEFGIRNKAKYKIIPLHSTLSSEEQNAVFQKPREGVTKIVIATNIAETSITIDDIVYVVDAGRMKEKRYDQTKSMESLETVWVSRANALQRRGRAGRVQEGVCFHLFTSHHFNFHLREQPIPEIQRACLEQLVLKIKMLPIFSEQDVESVLEELIEAPSLEAIHGAVKRLSDLGALDENVELTPLGYHVGTLPVDVRIGKLMLFGAIFRCLDSALTIAACLSFKSPFVSPFGLKQEADKKRKEFAMGNSDYLTMLNAYKGWTEEKEKGSHRAYLYCQENFLSIKTLQMLASLKQQYVELLSAIGFMRPGIRLRDVERAARKGSDGVADITGIEANVNSNNWKLMSGMLVAALYPNIVQILTPDTRYHATPAGAVVKVPNAEELRFKTKLDGFVSIHPSSVNFQVRHYSSPYLVYHEKVKTTKVYIRDSSMVSVYPLLLFGGGSISIDLYQGNFVLSVDDGWIKFMASSPQVAELVRDLRYEMDQLLSDKISQPDMDLLTCPRGSKIINCIVSLISSQ